MITYEQIEQANSKLSTIKLGKDGKQKDYVMVPQRVKAFRMLYPDGFILTDIISHENNIVMMQAKAGYYNEKGEQVVLGTGLAFEERNKGMVNGTSYIENCETSAVGRALGFLALGVDGGGICSAEELVNVIVAQNQAPAASRPAANTQVTTGSTVPAPVKATEPPKPAEPPKPETPGSFLKKKIDEMKTAIPGFDFMKARTELIQAGKVQDVPSATITMDQAKKLVVEMIAYYDEKKAS